MRPVYVKNRYMRRAAVLRIVFIDENRVAFRSQSGRYVAALHYGPKYSLVANRKRRGSWEIFTLKLIPVNGGISEWSSWTTCDVTCSGGDQTKSRQCNNPTPVNGGADCVEQTTTMQRCNMQACPVNGGISEWSSWTTCDVTCGGGDQTKSRQCNNPTPVNGGADCVEQTSTMQRCNIQACPTLCKDNSSSCSTYQQSGYCITVKNWMSANCKKTCNKC